MRCRSAIACGHRTIDTAKSTFVLWVESQHDQKSAPLFSSSPAFAFVAQIDLCAELSAAAGSTQYVQKRPRMLSHTNSSLLKDWHMEGALTRLSSGAACTEQKHSRENINE